MFTPDGKVASNNKEADTNKRRHGEIDGNSFIKTFEKKGVSDKKRKIRECFFVKKNGKNVFDDYDGYESTVFDTSLACTRSSFSPSRHSVIPSIAVRHSSRSSLRFGIDSPR